MSMNILKAACNNHIIILISRIEVKGNFKYMNEQAECQLHFTCNVSSFCKPKSSKDKDFNCKAAADGIFCLVSFNASSAGAVA